MTAPNEQSVCNQCTAIVTFKNHPICFSVVKYISSLLCIRALILLNTHYFVLWAFYFFVLCNKLNNLQCHVRNICLFISFDCIRQFVMFANQFLNNKVLFGLLLSNIYISSMKNPKIAHFLWLTSRQNSQNSK